MHCTLASCHMATSLLYPNGGTRQGRSPRKGLGPGPARTPNPSLLSTGPGPARPPKALTFIDRAWASPGPPTPHFYWRTPHFSNPSLLLANPSLLSTGPGPARPPTPHFYWPDPSLLSARPLALSARPGRQLASDPNLSVDSSAARNPCVSKINTAT